LEVFHLNTKKIIQSIIAEKTKIDEVFFVACGGSLVDLYPAKYFIDTEAKKVHAGFYTSKEFICANPKSLSENTITIICSHGGNTKETIEASEFAKASGSSVITLTNNAGSGVDKVAAISIVYEWGDEVSVADNPMAITLSLMNELLYAQEEYPFYCEMNDGFTRINSIVKNAVEFVRPRTKIFAEKYCKEPFLYVMSSGANFGQAYGFSICSLMEMQWMNACYIHSGEYFHGPFEVTDKDVLYVLLVNEGKTRCIDERAQTFLDKYAEKIEIVDAKELGLSIIKEDVVDYFNPILFYAVMCEYRAALAEIRNHPLETRRYMFKVTY
jgi:fructoselysine 6-phosphate deglycase